MKKNTTKITHVEIERMTPEELEAFLCGRLYDLFRAFPSLKEYQRREAMEIIFKLEYIAKPEEFHLWSRIVDYFKQLAEACSAREAA